ncbi:hypothetical protein ACRAWD_16420 [Caulobacter segnis]
MLIDSHVDLHAPRSPAEDKDAVITRAREAGVALMVTICDKVSSFEADPRHRPWPSRTSGARSAHTRTRPRRIPA